MAIVELSEAPKKARDLYNKALSAFERNNLDFAMDMFTTVLEIEPRLLQARRFLRASAVKKFKANKGNALTHGLASIKGLGKSMSVGSLIKKDPQRALMEAEKLLRMDPLNKSFIKQYTPAAVAAELPEAAVLTLEVAAEHYGDDLTLLKSLADLYMDVGDTRRGKEVFERIAYLKPNDQVAIKNYKNAAAIDAMNKGGWEGAKSYRDVMKDKDEAMMLEKEAMSAKSVKDIDLMIKQSLAKIEREPENINYRRGLAELYVKNKQFDEAIETLESAIAATGGGDPQIDLAMSQVKNQRFDFAIVQLEEEGNTELADEVRAKKVEFRLQDSEDRVKRYPNDLVFKFEYGVVLFEKGDINEAIQQFQQSQRNPARRIRSLYYLGLCFKAKKQYDIAAEQLEKACSEIQTMDKDKKDVLYNLGEIYEAVGNIELATTRYKEIYAVDISYRDIAQKIEQGYEKD